MTRDIAVRAIYSWGLDTNMLGASAASLTRRFIIVAIFGTSLVMAVFVALQLWASRSAEQQLVQLLETSLRNEWQQMIALQSTRMAANFREFTRDGLALAALADSDREALAQAVEPSFNRLSTRGALTGLVVVSAADELLYTVADPGPLAAPIAALSQALAARKTVTAIDHANNGHWGIVHAIPLFGPERRLLGAVAMFKELATILGELAPASQYEWLLSDDEHGFLYGTGSLASHPQVVAAAQAHGADVVEIAGQSLQVVTLAIDDVDHSNEVHVTRVLNVTASVNDARQRAWARYGVLALVVAGILGWIFRFVVRTASALHVQQREQIESLRIANDAAAKANQELHEAHAEIWQAFAAKEVAQQAQTRVSRVNQLLLETAGESIVGLDGAGHIVFSNPAAHRLLGYGAGELQSRSVNDIAGSVFDHDGAITASGLEGEAQFVRREGGFVPVAFNYRPIIELGQPSGAVVTFNDMSARKAFENRLIAEKETQAKLIKQLEDAQNQLLQAEKMASIGQLAAGVAHEINNPVGYVNSNLGSLKQYVEELLALVESHPASPGATPAPGQPDLQFIKNDIRQLLQESEEGLSRVKQIVQDLKDFSHVDSSAWSVVDLHRGLDSTLNLVHNEIKYKANVVKEYGALPPVECLAAQLNQVFTNLLVNAVQAIEQRGTIWVRTGHAGDFVWVEIEDNGKGIEPEHLGRIFEPFFTTKPVGKGTGLGLSVTYGIVEKHGGRIEVASELGKGTRFRVWLPVARAQRDSEVEAQASLGKETE